MSQTEFVTKIDSRRSINVPKVLQDAGYKTGTKVRVILEIVKAQLNKDSEIRNKIDELFYQGYFEEFLEELEEKNPVLFQNYIESRKVKPSEKGEVTA